MRPGRRGPGSLVVLQPDLDRLPVYQRFRELAVDAMRGSGIEFMDANALERLTTKPFLDAVHLTSDRLVASAVAARPRGPRRRRFQSDRYPSDRSCLRCSSVMGAAASSLRLSFCANCC